MTLLRLKRILKKLWLLSVLGREDRRIKKVYEEKPPYNYYKEKKTMVKKENSIKLSSENSAIPFLNSDHWFHCASEEGKFWRYSWHYKGYPVGFQPVIFFRTENGVPRYLLSLDNSLYPTLEAAQMAALTFIRKRLKSQIENVGGIVSFLSEN